MFDQVTLFMIFIMLCFAGITAMFYFILRGLDELCRELKGERSQLVGLLQSMESSLDILVKASQISLQRQPGQESQPAVSQNKADASGTIAPVRAASAYAEPLQPNDDLGSLQLGSPKNVHKSQTSKNGFVLNLKK